MSGRYDVVIIGAGIMGLLSGYRIVQAGGRVAVLEKRVIGNGEAGSSGLTRSLRSDYADPTYAALAREAYDGWKHLEAELGQSLVVETGCLNLAVDRTPTNYAQEAADWLKRDARPAKRLESEDAITKRFPQFRGFRFAVLEEAAGLGFPVRAVEALRGALAASDRCDLFENVTVKKIRASRDRVVVSTHQGELIGRKLVIAAGLGTPQVLERIENSAYRLKLNAERPDECVYFFPKDPRQYDTSNLPIFACLDKGIYGHPIVRGLTKGVKTGRYNPPESVSKSFRKTEDSLADFVRDFVPGLAQCKTQPVTDTDRCAYDMTADGGFAVGPIPGAPQVFMAAGFCGTGYKFAPVIADSIADFVAGRPCRYDLGVLNPAREGLGRE